MLESSDLSGTRPSKNNTSISECPDSFAKWYCLNGATCFSIKIRDSTLYNCWCPMGFHGLRCDYKYVESNYPLSTDSLSEEYNQMALTLTLSKTTTKDEVVQNRHEALNNRQQTRGIHLILYNLMVLFLIVILIMLILRFLRRKTPAHATISHSESEGRGSIRQNVTPKNGQINHDNVFVELDMIKHGLFHDDNRTQTEYQHHNQHHQQNQQHRH